MKVPVGSILVLAALGVGVLCAQQPPFTGLVEVNRLVVEVRVLDAFRRPVFDLTTADFAVRLDGEPARVEAVEWHGAIASTADLSARPRRHDEPEDEVGRTIVLLFQTDLHAVRVKGLMRMMQRADDLLARLSPGDRVAVAVFGSHLELHADFTDDTAELRRQLTMRGILASAPPPAPAEGMSLAAVLDLVKARQAASLERALELLGVSLERLPGSKSMVLFGWGIGRYARDGVRLGASYRRAAAALSRSRTSVFALDVTDADSHSLEVGLRAAARDTGGLYEKTHLFPDLALDRIGSALLGHWEVVVETRPRPPGAQVRLELEVQRDGVLVLAPRYIYVRGM